MSRKRTFLKYRKHSSGQARVTIDGLDHLLGDYGSAASWEQYHRLQREWLEDLYKPKQPLAEPLTVEELLAAFWKHAQRHYRLVKGCGDYYCWRDALKVVRSLYGRLAAADFGPKALKAVRGEMIDRRQWSRTYTNAQIDRVRRVFRYAVEEESFPTAGDVYQCLRAVAGLRRGQTDARETKRVLPVAPEHVEATLPLLPPHVRAMVELQLVTGCRPAEVCLIRPIDIDRGNPLCWIFRPAHHKTEHHGHDRLVFMGPKAQEILKPFLGTKLDGYCFAPAESERRRAQLRRLERRSPLTPSQRERQPKARRRRAPSERYDVAAYRRAIARTCKKANVPSWAPNRLRHSRATELRRAAGLDVVKTVLGHSKVETTQLYAEKDLAAAMELVSKLG